MTFFIGRENNKKGVFAEPGFSEVVKSKVAIQILTKKSLSNNPVSHFFAGKQIALVEEYLVKMFSINHEPTSYNPNMTYTPIKYSGPVEDNFAQNVLFQSINLQSKHELHPGKIFWPR
jgi:hypothetical protein